MFSTSRVATSRTEGRLAQLVLVKAESLTDPGLVGRSLPRAIDGEQPLAPPAFVVGKAVVEQPVGP